ncbi:hypothetical protein PR048_023031 [Dryococelus australis]|uniref:Uncharacterized protein n=1 Tax=Dryococelus australis TaxID=614101 RepID=A0ABQ9GSY6_9NEOP|nr:hypothetical protein PR048_023031 [Dryococelus australis]
MGVNDYIVFLDISHCEADSHMYTQYGENAARQFRAVRVVAMTHLMCEAVSPLWTTRFTFSNPQTRKPGFSDTSAQVLVRIENCMLPIPFYQLENAERHWPSSIAFLRMRSALIRNINTLHDVDTLRGRVADWQSEGRGFAPRCLRRGRCLARLSHREFVSKQEKKNAALQTKISCIFHYGDRPVRLPTKVETEFTFVGVAFCGGDFAPDWLMKTFRLRRSFFVGLSDYCNSSLRRRVGLSGLTRCGIVNPALQFLGWNDRLPPSTSVIFYRRDHLASPRSVASNPDAKTRLFSDPAETEVSMEHRRNAGAGVKGRSPRKPADKRHRPGTIPACGNPWATPPPPGPGIEPARARSSTSVDESWKRFAAKRGREGDGGRPRVEGSLRLFRTALCKQRAGPRPSGERCGGEIWAAINIEVLRADEGESRWERSSAGTQGRGETGDTIENSPVSIIARHDYHTRKSESDPTGNRTWFASLERASQKQSINTHKTSYDRVKRCRERKDNIKASERVNGASHLRSARPVLDCPREQNTKRVLYAQTFAYKHKVKLYARVAMREEEVWPFFFRGALVFSAKRKREAGEAAFDISRHPCGVASSAAGKSRSSPWSWLTHVFVHVLLKASLSGAIQTYLTITMSSGPRWLSGWPARLPPRRTGFNPRPDDPNFRMWESCWTMPLVVGFSRGSPHTNNCYVASNKRVSQRSEKGFEREASIFVSVVHSPPTTLVRVRFPAGIASDGSLAWDLILHHHSVAPADDYYVSVTQAPRCASQYALPQGPEVSGGVPRSKRGQYLGGVLGAGVELPHELQHLRSEARRVVCPALGRRVVSWLLAFPSAVDRAPLVRELCHQHNIAHVVFRMEDGEAERSFVVLTRLGVDFIPASEGYTANLQGYTKGMEGSKLKKNETL